MADDEAAIRRWGISRTMMVRVLSAPDTITVKLAGTNEWKQAWGSVKYNGRMGTVMYSADELPKLPADKIYQMWVVPVGGTPISAGLFAPGANGNERLWTAQVPANTEPKAFAVTIEPWGGVAQPTGPKVLLDSPQR